MGLNEATCRKLYARRKYKCTYWAIVGELRPMLIERGGLGSAYTKLGAALIRLKSLR